MSRALTLFVLGAMCLPYIFAQQTCGHPCTVNTECDNDPDCNLCMGGKCASGCGGGCVVDSDCGDLNCRSCTDGICQNSPQHTCGGGCKRNSDCSQDGSNPCQLCTKDTFVCTVGCGQPCANSTQCKNSSCIHCILGQCAAANVPCGGICTTDLDCVQSSVCSSCVAGKCGAGCSHQCNQNSDCLDTNCKYCVTTSTGGHICSHTQNGQKCHDRCKVNTDCTGSPGTCQFCVGFKCGSPCGTTCKQASDCITSHCNNCNASGYCGPS